MAKLTPAEFETFIEKSTSLLLNMANANRLAVLRALVGTELSVGVLAVMVGLSHSALSQHLSKLRTANLVKTRRDAQSVFYSCTSPEVIEMISTLEAIYAVKDRKS